MKLVGYLARGVRNIGRIDGDKVVPLGTVADFYAGGSEESVDGVLDLGDL
jgi:hypothetical protein